MDVRAGWPGRVTEVKVAAGDRVAVEQELLILESMKMLTPIPSPVAGAVEAVLVRADDLVTDGQVLVRITPG